MVQDLDPEGAQDTREEQAEAHERPLGYASRVPPQLCPTDRMILSQVSFIRGERGDVARIYS